MGQNDFGDREMLDDALSSQKAIAGGYNLCANECAAPALKTELMNLLCEEHQIQHELFLEMQKRGWYQPEPADDRKVTQVRQAFQAKGGG